VLKVPHSIVRDGSGYKSITEKAISNKI